MEEKDVVSLKRQIMLAQRAWFIESARSDEKRAHEVMGIMAHLMEYRPTVFKGKLETLFGGSPSPSPQVVLERLYKLMSTIRVT